jgi:signal transduction histidine kinase
VPLFRKKAWLSSVRKWFVYAFISLIITISVALFGIITYTNESTKDNSRRVFESSLWAALQLQIQTYRFIAYLTELDDSDYPLNGEAFFEYDLVMSRVDLLRRGEIGALIRYFEEGRTIKQLNLINGELELLSFNVSRLEERDLSYRLNLIERIERLQPQINELVALVNKGSTAYINTKHKSLQKSLSSIQFLSITLLICLLFLSFFTIKVLVTLQMLLKDNKVMKTGIQAVNDNKANMLSFIHQELRSPINAILSVAKTLNNTSPMRPSIELSKHIEESGYQLLKSIEMLSDFTHIEANRLTLTPTTDNLQTRVEACLMALEQQMSRKDLQSIVYTDPKLPKDVILDFNRFNEIITCLLQNSISHTASGSISVQVRPSTLGVPLANISTTPTQEARMLQIAVKDTGFGMPNQLQKNLRMTPLLPKDEDESLLRKIGLNLAVCYKLVDLMNGEIHFYNTPQEGCEFWVDIPFHVSRHNHSINNDAIELELSKHELKKNVLLIETDSHLIKIITQQLTCLSINCKIFKEGSTHWDDKYDAIIVGNSLWFERDGLDMMRQWNKKGCPILSYHKKAIEHVELQVTPLTFPLLQSQLDTIMAHLFSKK